MAVTSSSSVETEVVRREQGVPRRTDLSLRLPSGLSEGPSVAFGWDAGPVEGSERPFGRRAVRASITSSGRLPRGDTGGRPAYAGEAAVQAADRYPEWVTCHQVTRSAAGPLVRCPRRGLVLTDDCMRCRFLTASSVERSVGPWCELPGTPLRPAVERPVEPPLEAPREAPFELPPRAPLPRRKPWPLDLPLVAAGPVAAAGRPATLVPVGPGRRAHAVRPAEPVPSGQPIGT